MVLYCNPKSFTKSSTANDQGEHGTYDFDLWEPFIYYPYLLTGQLHKDVQFAGS